MKKPGIKEYTEFLLQVAAQGSGREIAHAVCSVVAHMKRHRAYALAPLVLESVERRLQKEEKNTALTVQAAHAVDANVIATFTKVLDAEGAPVRQERDEGMRGGAYAAFEDKRIDATLHSLFAHWKAYCS